MKLGIIISTILILIVSAKSVGQNIDNSKASSSQFEISIEFHSHIQQTKTRIFFNNNFIKVLRKPEINKINEDTLFSVKLTSTDSLDFIDKIQCDSLQPYYSNPCVDDGFALEIFLSKDNRTKHTILDNYYQVDVGKIITFINARLPIDYRIEYDKNKLVSDYRKCEDILLKEK